VLGFFIAIGFLLITSIIWIVKSYNGVFNSASEFGPIVPFSIDYVYNLAAILLPVFLFWLLFLLIYFAYVLNRNQKYMQYLMLGNKKTSEYMESLVREMMQSRNETAAAAFLNNFDLVLEVFSQDLLDIIVKSHISSDLALAKVIDKNPKVKNWGLCNIIIESSQNLPNFELAMRSHVQKVEGLMWSINQFTSKYDNLVRIVQENGADKIVQSFVQEGSLAKVYFLLNRVINFSDKN
jgi:hypothetical protein